ncbi:MAG: hypothetical protein Q8P57_05185 [Candidatus Pacearchaeota archaeon]|nr:hypothetical protein [Candidatus Pacearchaeota archaeon]
MEEILQNAIEFLESAEDSLKKQRWNVAVANYFKSASNFCDYLIYKEIKLFPKNHNERFQLLEKYFPEIHKIIIDLFKKYRESYNLRLKRRDALPVRQFAYELKTRISDKK